MQLLRNYRDGFISDYQAEASECLFEDESQPETILNSLLTGSGCFIKGLSGCGKTLAATYFSVELSKLGSTVFFIRAKDYSGSLSNLLNKEAQLILGRDYRELMKAISKAQADSFFVIDGLNELSEEHLRQVLRGVKALVRRYGAKILATSQRESPTLLEALEKFEVGLPSENLKKRIAAKASAVLSDAALEVLSAVGTGLEAKIVGEMQAKLERNTTRLNLLDQYMRERLGKSARSGSSAFRYFATYLLEKVAFSTSESEFDIRMMKNGFSAADCDALLDSGILVNRSGRVSFTHEMYYYACASHGYAVEAVNDPDSVGDMLNKPIYAPLAYDVISAIEDEQTVLVVIKHITNAKLLADAADGDLGLVAKSAAISLLKVASERVRAEINSSGLEIQYNNGIARLDWDCFTKIEFLPEEIAQYQAIGVRASRGTGVAEYLALCRAMDARLMEARARLRDEAGKVKLALRSSSFQLAYLGFGSKTSFHFVTDGTRAIFNPKKKYGFPKFTSMAALSSGELYFVLEHAFEWNYKDEVWFAEELVGIIANRYRYEPYHVQLSILDSAGYMRRHEQALIDRLVTAIQSLDTSSIWMNSIIIDALKGLGALEDSAEVARITIQEQVNAIINGEDCNDKFESALFIYVARFDHPFDWIFYEEMARLAPELVHKLHICALKASNINHSISKASIIEDIIAFNDKEDLPILSRFTQLPSKSSSFPQGEVKAFVRTIGFLAKYNYPLPVVEINDERDYCFNAFRKIIYAMYSNQSEAKEVASHVWQTLEGPFIEQAMAVLYEIVVDGSGYYESKVVPSESILKVYPKNVLSLARQFISLGRVLDFSHSYRAEEATQFAFYLIGELGDRSDLGRLIDLIRFSKSSRQLHCLQ